MNEMHDWCGMAQGESEGNGMPAPFWGNMDRWLRKNVHDIRRATEDKGEGRFDVKRVEDVGFFFENGKDGVGRTPPIVDTASRGLRVQPEAVDTHGCQVMTCSFALHRFPQGRSLLL